jgi:hypothetical protein
MIKSFQSFVSVSAHYQQVRTHLAGISDNFFLALEEWTTSVLTSMDSAWSDGFRRGLPGADHSGKNGVHS